MLLIVLATIFGILDGGRTEPLEPGEHRMLADSALSVVLNELGDLRPSIPDAADSRLSLSTPIWGDRNFGRLVEVLAANDGAASRFQKAGRTVYEQLAEVTENQLRSFWERVAAQSGEGGEADLVEPGSSTAVGNYLLVHLAALHFAAEAGSPAGVDERSFYLALAYEAMAQGFLADAHASGHLLVPRHDAFQILHPVNNGKAHRYYNSVGVYVVNGRQEAWQTFGDGVLTWYTRSYRQVLAASVTSLREVLLSFYAAGGSIPALLQQWVKSFTDRSASDLVADWLTWKRGDAYYERYASLPSLSYIPMPVAATWSIRRDAKDRNGIRVRQHYPQLIENQLHDPELPRVLLSELYSEADLPSRFIPYRSTDSPSVADAAEADRDAASVEFFQVHILRPDYSGLLLGFGMGMMTGDDQSAPALTGSLGYGLAEDLLIARHVSVNVGITKSLEDDHVSPVKATFGMNPAGLPLHAEIGYVTTTDDFMSESGLVLSGAYDLTSQVLGLTYIGVAVRLAYEVMFLDEVLHAPSIRIAFY